MDIIMLKEKEAEQKDLILLSQITIYLPNNHFVYDVRSDSIYLSERVFGTDVLTFVDADNHEHRVINTPVKIHWNYAHRNSDGRITKIETKGTNNVELSKVYMYTERISDEFVVQRESLSIRANRVEFVSIYGERITLLNTPVITHDNYSN